MDSCSHLTNLKWKRGKINKWTSANGERKKMKHKRDVYGNRSLRERLPLTFRSKRVTYSFWNPIPNENERAVNRQMNISTKCVYTYTRSADAFYRISNIFFLVLFFFLLLFVIYSTQLLCNKNVANKTGIYHENAFKLTRFYIRI